MKNFVRGGITLTVVGLFVVFIYAQTKTTETLSSAKDSQKTVDNNKNFTKGYLKAELEEKTSSDQRSAFAATNTQDQVQDQDKDKDKIKKTVSSRAVTGKSKGTFSATAYCLKGRTALGHGVRRGIIAADPRILKLGSQIFLNAGSYSGQYLVSDTGGGVKGNEIDIWMPSCAEARRFGRRKVTISQL